MRSSHLIFFLFISLINIQAQKDYSNFLNVFSEAQRVVDSFVYYNQSSVPPQFQDVDWRLKDIRSCIKFRPTKKIKPPQIHIKNFNSLSAQEVQLFDTLYQKYGNGNTTLNFYYNIILHWLLPHSLHHQIARPIKRENYASYSEFLYEDEKLIDIRTYQFMVKAEFNLEFQDFLSMISAIINYTRPKNVAYVQEIHERQISMNLLAKKLFLNASSMLSALEYLISGKDISLISSHSEYYKTDDDIEVKGIINEKIEAILGETDLNWEVEIISSKDQSEIIQHNLKRKRLKINIKSYNSLLGSEKAFLKDVQAKYGNEEEPIDFYYKLISQWLLPKELQKSRFQLGQVDLAEDDTKFHRMTLTEMPENGTAKQFKNFDRLCNTIITITKQQRTQEQISAWEDKSMKPNVEYNLFKSAKQIMP